MIIVKKDTTPIADECILLGRQCENEARQIEFDLSWLIDEYGSGTAVLVHQRNKDVAPYICTTTQSDNILTWTLDNQDTVYDGWGQAELRWTVGDVLAKTLIYKTMVIRSITADTTIPEPLESWYDEMIDYIDEHGIDPEALAEAIAAYLEEHPVEAPVQSVNNKTGAVVLTASDVGAGTYSKPNDGIPKTDLTSGVQASLDKADSALQSAPVTSVNNKTGAITLNASDVGAGTYSKPSGGIPASDLASAVQTSLGKADSALQTAPVVSVNNKTGAITLTASDVGAGTYSKPSGGIPASDLASAVQTSLGKADTALQSAPVSSVNSKTGAVVLNAGDLGYDGTATYSSGTVGDELSDLKEDISDIDDRVTALESGGITADAKQALLQIARKVAYIDNDGRNYYNDLYNALYPPKPATAISLSANSLSFSELNTAQQLTATLTPSDTSDTVTWASSDTSVASVNSYGVVTALSYGTATITATAGLVSATCSVAIVQAAVTSISAVYTQSGTVYDTDSLNDLKSDLVVTAYYDNQTSATVTDYTLSGTLTAGSSTITVTYESKTTTFTVTVTHASIDLDTIVYEGKSYRDIFMTANQVQGFDFENGLPAGVTINSGSPSISTDDCYSSSHAVKAFGSTSQQYKSTNQSGSVDWIKYSGKQYFVAYKGKCTRYVKGWLGFNQIHGCPNITSVTDGWVTKYIYNTVTGGQSYTQCFFGSGSSADLDGYLDDMVVIPMSDVFTVIPSESDMLQYYNDYCDLRKAGES